MRARDVKIEALQDEAQTTQPIFGEGDQDTKCGPLLMLGSGLGLLLAN